MEHFSSKEYEKIGELWRKPPKINMNIKLIGEKLIKYILINIESKGK